MWNKTALIVAALLAVVLAVEPATVDNSMTCQGLLLPGEVRLFTGQLPPPQSWLLCDGSAVPREQYVRLFSAVGVKYGAGDGNTTFNLPEFKSVQAIPRTNDEQGTVTNVTTDEAAAVYIIHSGVASSNDCSSGLEEQLADLRRQVELINQKLNCTVGLQEKCQKKGANGSVKSDVDVSTNSSLSSTTKSDESSVSKTSQFQQVPLTAAQKQKFMYLRLSPLEPDTEGKYATIDWEQYKNVTKLKWSEMVNGDEQAKLHFPPLHVLDERPEIVAFLFGRRRGKYFKLFGGLLQKVAAAINPLTVRLQIRMEFVRADGQQLVDEKDAVVHLENEYFHGSVYRLLTVFDVPWRELSASVTPLATLIRIRPTNVPLSRFYHFGLAPLSAIDGDYGLIDWQNLTGTLNYKREWKDMVDGDEQASLHFPPLVIADKVIVVMFAQRRGDDLEFSGGLHEHVNMFVEKRNIAVNLELAFHHKNGKIEQRKFNQSIAFNHKADIQFNSIFSFSALKWSDLSSALTPRATRLVFKATKQ